MRGGGPKGWFDGDLDTPLVVHTPEQRRHAAVHLADIAVRQRCVEELRLVLEILDLAGGPA